MVRLSTLRWGATAALALLGCSQKSGLIPGRTDSGPVVARDAAPLEGAPPDGGDGGEVGGPSTGQALLSVSFEAQGCAAENASFTALTKADCDDATRATDGRQSATLNFTQGRNMLASHGAFSVSSGTIWLSYDLYAARRPGFTIMMDAWQRGQSPSDADNPWSNRNPFSIEWRDGWFAMSCAYPNDHDTERRSREVSSGAGVGTWANVVVRYDLDREQGAFWVRTLDDDGRPAEAIDPDDPAGRVDCSHYGDRGAFSGLALTDFQNPSPPAVTVFTDRWILTTDPSMLP